MIIGLLEKYDARPDWLEEQVRDAMGTASPTVVEQLFLPQFRTLPSVYKVKDEAGREM